MKRYCMLSRKWKLSVFEQMDGFENGICFHVIVSVAQQLWNSYL